jgi:hypothetical protein
MPEAAGRKQNWLETDNRKPKTGNPQAFPEGSGETYLFHA